MKVKKLKIYYVHYLWSGEPVQIFKCHAENKSHAIEQCDNAYPKCKIGSIEVVK